jgi:hypothetical protein
MIFRLSCLKVSEEAQYVCVCLQNRDTDERRVLLRALSSDDRSHRVAFHLVQTQLSDRRSEDIDP